MPGTPVSEAAAPCPRCSWLENELTQEREERRQLSRDLRDLHQQYTELLRENGDLRARLAHWEGRTGIQPDAAEGPAANSA